jgi:hypothetical protein
LAGIVGMIIYAENIRGRRRNNKKLNISTGRIYKFICEVTHQ